MALRLRPRRGPLEQSTSWHAGGSRPSPSLIYRDLLRCSARDREEAVSFLRRRGLSDEEARALRPSYLGDYAGKFRKLRAKHGLCALARAGLLSQRGNLLYWRHRLLLPIPGQDGLPAGVVGLAAGEPAKPAALLPRGLPLEDEARARLDALLKRMEAAGAASQLSLSFR